MDISYTYRFIYRYIQIIIQTDGGCIKLLIKINGTYIKFIQ